MSRILQFKIKINKIMKWMFWLLHLWFIRIHRVIVCSEYSRYDFFSDIKKEAITLKGTYKLDFCYKTGLFFYDRINYKNSYHVSRRKFEIATSHNRKNIINMKMFGAFLFKSHSHPSSQIIKRLIKKTPRYNKKYRFRNILPTWHLFFFTTRRISESEIELVEVLP